MRLIDFVHNLNMKFKLKKNRNPKDREAVWDHLILKFHKTPQGIGQRSQSLIVFTQVLVLEIIKLKETQLTFQLNLKKIQAMTFKRVKTSS